LTLQQFGFRAIAHDFDHSRLQSIKDNTYPNEEQLNSWTRGGKIPRLDLKYLELTNKPDELFKSKLHIVSFPYSDDTGYNSLVNYFSKNSDKLKDSLIIFQSAGVPGDIELNFSKAFIKYNIKIDIATVFRGDWSIEEFLNKSSQRVVSANNSNALNKLNNFLDLLNIKTIPLQSIKEAEMYENTKNALNYMVTAFFNQLSIAYPDINLNNICKNILNEFNRDDILLGVSGVDYKTEQSIDNLIKPVSNNISLLKEANSINISFLYYYVSILKNKNINSVTILGLSSYNSIKDLRFSPSIILAEYLYKEGLEVYLHDDNFSKCELLKILPYANFIDIDNQLIESDVVVMMNIIDRYRFFTQAQVEKMGLYKVRYVLDNTGFLKNYMYSDSTIYHHLCDGNLIEVLNS